MLNPEKGNASRAPSRRDLSDCNGPGETAAQSVILPKMLFSGSYARG